MNLNQLYYFQMVAELQHYHQAAAELNISQPSLSRSMANLEEELGLFLFEKQGRNIVLTKYGRIFAEHVNKIIDELENTKKRMENLASSTDGHIDIAYVSPLAKHYIPFSARRFLDIEENRNVTFSFSQDYTAKMIEGLKADRFDVVFGSYSEGESDLSFVPIIRQELVAIVPHDHELAGLDEIEARQIENYSLIAYERYSGLGKFTRKLFKELEINPEIICESSDEGSIVALVEAGFGVAIVARVSEVERANVKILPLKDVGMHHDVYMIYHKYRYLAPAVQNFINFIKKQAASTLK